MNIAEIIRREIEETDETRYSIAKKTGISEATLCRLFNKIDTGFSVDVAGKLLSHFGYELKKERK